MSRRVVFFGTERFSAPSLRALIDAGYDIAFVVTKPDTKRGRGQRLVSPEVKQIAEAHNINVLQPVTLSEIIPVVSQLFSPVAVLVAYGKIIPRSVIDLFSPGIINVHPSLLPRYRGPSPIEAAIINGDAETGISIMKLSAAMDAGPVYVQRRIPLSSQETKPQLYETYAQIGADLLTETLPHIIDGSLKPTPQDNEHASYCSLLRAADGRLDPNTKTAQQLERQIRAHLGYPKSKLLFGEHELIITAAHVGDKTEPFSLACADNSHLVIDELIAPSGKKMNADAFIHGYWK